MYTVIYDGQCNLCANLVRLLEVLDRGAQFRYVPMQDEATLATYGVTSKDCEQGMLLIGPFEQASDQSAQAVPMGEMQRWQGSDAAEEIGRLLPFGKPFVEAYRALPRAKSTGDRTYAFIRDNRYALFGKRQKIYTSDYPCTEGNCKL